MELVASHELSEVEEPGEEAFDLPATPVASEVAAVLGEDLSAGTVRRDQRDALAREPRVERVAVVGFVADEEARAVDNASEEALAKKVFQERRLVGGSRFEIDGERKTRAVDHCHDLGPLAALGFSDVEPPFLAPANVPSTNASSGSSPPRSRRSRASASTIVRSVPSRTQALKRRWQVAYGGYLRGMSFHGAPVRSTHKTPFSTSRDGVHGRPLPSSRTGSSGINGSRIAHCSSVSSIHQGQPQTRRHGNTLAESTAISIPCALTRLWNLL
jgi:hypothetical protein